ncbi:MAG: V-type ATP synthase subunit I [Planctomycetota bacterium]
MIVAMRKMYAAVRASESGRLLTALRDLGVVHVQPVDVEQARPDETTATVVQRLARAEQVLSDITPRGDRPDLSPLDAADRVLELFGRASELNTRLAALTREVDQLSLWGDLRLDQLAALDRAGLTVRFYCVEPDAVADVPGDCVEQVGWTGTHARVAAVYRETPVPEDLPESIQPLHLPEHDRPTLRAEARTIHEQQTADAADMARLAHLRDAIADEHARRSEDARYVTAERSGVSDEALYALQGWVPEDAAGTLGEKLADAGVDAGVDFLEPSEDESPPTLIRYPRWARPMQAMFDILGTTPGYREYDLSPFFMIALPLFAAMLIGDAGYGAIFTAIGLLAYGKIRKAAGAPAAQLIVVFGAVTLTWGLITGNVFGVSPGQMSAAGGLWAAIGRPFAAIAFLWSADATVARNMIIKASFIFGTLHLVAAHVRQAIGLAPNVRFLSEIGWSVFLVGMLGVVWLLFFPDQVWMPTPVLAACLIGGFVLVLLFTHPSRNPVKMLALGVVTNLLPTLSTFSDTMSYIRLMAVGLASYYIAFAFNGLAMQIAAGGAVMWIFAALILVLAHAMNVALGIIAIFAHGVRLNMLEFSSNAGVQWEGYPYAPFRHMTPLEKAAG